MLALVVRSTPAAITVGLDYPDARRDVTPKRGILMTDTSWR